MTITLTLTPEIAQAITDHVRVTLKTIVVADNQTAQVPMFSSIENFIESVLSQVFEHLLRTFPQPSVSAKMEQVKTLEEEIRNLSKANVVRAL